MSQAIHPGVILAEELTSRQMTRSELARRSAIDTKHLGEIIDGKRAITPKLAFNLGRALDMPAKFWVNLQASYDAALAHQKQGGPKPA